MAKKRVNINYTAKDFNSIREELIEYAKRYYGSVNKDFSESSFGSLMIDSVSYIGDVLSFFQDYYTNESFLDSAIEYNNIIRHGRSLGYKFKGPPSSYGVVTLYCIVPSKVSGLGPDTNYLPVLLKGSEFSSVDGNGFILLENVDFSKNDNEVVVAEVSDSTGMPISYAVKSSGKIISGELSEEQITVGEFQKFLKVKMSGKNIAEIMSVTDSEGHDYYEVETLSQNIVYRSVLNKNIDKDYAPEILKPIIVTRRYVVEQDGNMTYLQFGFGSEDEIRTTNVLEPTNVVLKMLGKDYITDSSFDPTKLLESDKFGVAPSNTILRIVSRNNTSENVNSATATITEIKNAIVDFDNPASLDLNKMNAVIASLECSNDEPIVGDISLPESEELRIRIIDNYSSQNRAVSLQDYKSLVYNMPSRFGAVKRCLAIQDNDSFKRNINLYVISENAGGNFVQTNNTIKNNIKVWLSDKKMINDSLDILSTTIYNIGIEFEVVVRDDVNKYSALATCTQELINYYDKKFDIGESFLITDIYKVLKNVDDVLDVTDVQIVNKNGGVYSDAKLIIEENLSRDGRMIKCPVDGIFEIKYLRSDIVGKIR